MKRVLIFISIFLTSCVIELPTSPALDIDFQNIESRTIPLGDNAKTNMNGIYTVVHGTETFGD